MIKIVTDTDANLSQAQLDELGVEAVPIQIIFGDEIMRERVDVSDEEAYARISAADPFPTTSQPSVGEFKATYEAIFAKHPDAEILSIHVSGKLSGTLNSAMQAADMLDQRERITCFDTLSISYGQGLMVREAAVMAQNGAAIPEIIARLEVMRDGMRVYFVLHTMDYLARSGRIGKASQMMGAMLDIKPVLSIEDGLLGAHSRQRTWKKAVASIRDLAIAGAQSTEGNGPLHIAVVHAMNADSAEKLIAELKQALSPDVFIDGHVGPGLGVHSGPGALGVCFVKMPD